MSIVIFLILFVLSLGAAAFAVVKRGVNLKKAIVVQLASVVMIFGACIMLSPDVQAAESTSASQSQTSDENDKIKTSTTQGIGYIGMGIAIGLGCIGAGIALAAAAPAAIGAASEDPKSVGKSIIFVGMAESIVLFGLLIAFFINMHLA